MGCVILGQRGSACVEGQVRDLMTKIVDVGGVLGRVTVLLPRPDLGRSSDYRTLLSPPLPPPPPAPSGPNPLAGSCSLPCQCSESHDSSQ